MALTEYNDMEGVSLKEFHEWLQKNKHYTWFVGEDGGFRQGGKALVKYIDLGFDTRDMQVFRLKAQILDTEVLVTTANQCINPIVQEHKFKTILDYFDFHIQNGLKEINNAKNS